MHNRFQTSNKMNLSHTSPALITLYIMSILHREKGQQYIMTVHLNTQKSGIISGKDMKDMKL